MSDRKRIGRILVFFGVGFILNFLIRNGLADIINLFLKEGRIPNVSLSLYYLIKISVGIIMTGIGIYMLKKDYLHILNNIHALSYLYYLS